MKILSGSENLLTKSRTLIMSSLSLSLEIKFSSSSSLSLSFSLSLSLFHAHGLWLLCIIDFNVFMFLFIHLITTVDQLTSFMQICINTSILIKRNTLIHNAVLEHT